MLLSLRFLLSPKHTYRVNQHTVRPYAHWFSHQRSNASLFRVVPFPDVLPQHSPTFRIVQENFMSLSSPRSSRDSNSSELGYDYIVTLFFIDTALDVISTLKKIYTLLRPGGLWVNLGPLLWTGGAQAKLELSLEEVMSVVEEVGFQLLTDPPRLTRRTVECEYTGDRDAMMTWIYKAEFWVARKV